MKNLSKARLQTDFAVFSFSNSRVVMLATNSAGDKSQKRAKYTVHFTTGRMLTVFGLLYVR
ncbi:hypothetical protein OH784_02995 [Ectobacillus funiculus]|uniref:hypothetical protein n=1 Tax=Ectobacillus funiculus TaxID=137993 RepID=UPI003979CA86